MAPTSSSAARNRRVLSPYFIANMASTIERVFPTARYALKRAGLSTGRQSGFHALRGNRYGLGAALVEVRSQQGEVLREDASVSIEVGPGVVPRLPRRFAVGKFQYDE